MVWLSRTGGTVILASLLAVAAPSPAAALQQQQGPDSLTELSLQELMSLEVFSVSKSARKLSESAAAVYVITSEEIRRSGATTIPEVLRTVPGLQVARLDANKWAISARGFNGRFANKLLVLIDGRSVYTPLFSGVFWDRQDTLLEDIDRIEVIRGPGATLWGANAVNGIINIITKTASDTTGAYATLSHGPDEGTNAAVRYGGPIGVDTHWRVWAKAFDRDPFQTLDGSEGADEWEMVRGGFRVDSILDSQSRLHVQGGIYTGETGSTHDIGIPRPPFRRVFDVDTVVRGAHVLAEYDRELGDGSDLGVRFYYDRTDLREPLFTEERNTFDVELQHRVALDARHTLIWGAGYRASRDDIGESFTISVDPDERQVDLFSAFVQDDIRLADGDVRLTLGTKLEHNEFTGWEVQPNVRFLWQVDPRNTLWAAVSRAVRTPSRIEHDGRIVASVLPPMVPQNPGPLPVAVTILADGRFDSENLLAYELGYRLRASDTLSFDLAAFYNDYDELRDSVRGQPVFGNGFLVVPLQLVNTVEAQTWGTELAVEWQPTVWTRLRGGFSYLGTESTGSSDTGVQLGASAPETGANPSYQGFVWASMEPLNRVELDLRLRFADELPIRNVSGYVTGDARIAWRLDHGLELSLVGQNLLDDERLEFVSELSFLGLPARIPRSVYAAATWEF